MLGPGEVVALEEAGGGRNSRVYRLTLESQACYALKVYFRHASDDRARMDTEFASLAFLWENGVRNVPRPVAASQEDGLAIYAWIEGRKIGPQEVTAEAIEAAICAAGRGAVRWGRLRKPAFRAARCWRIFGGGWLLCGGGRTVTWALFWKASSFPRSSGYRIGAVSEPARCLSRSWMGRQGR